MAQAPVAISVHHEIGNSSRHCRLKPVTERSIVICSILKLCAREFHRFAKCDNAGHVLSSRTSLALLVSTDILAMQTDPAAHVKRADAFRRIQLVRRYRQQIATKLVHMQTQSSGSLHCIRMKQEMPVS